MTSWLHEQRLQDVQTIITQARATSVLDLGCGDGDLIVRLAADPQITQIVGVDICTASLARLRDRLALEQPPHATILLHQMSMTSPDRDLSGFDCATLIETIEHLDPAHLSQLEQALFRKFRPGIVIITTPNAEFNPLLGVPASRFRHPGHRFEWPRAKFRNWARRAADAARYDVAFSDIGGAHPDLGGASQMGVFRKTAKA